MYIYYKKCTVNHLQYLIIIFLHLICVNRFVATLVLGNIKFWSPFNGHRYETVRCKQIPDCSCDVGVHRT